VVDVGTEVDSPSPVPKGEGPGAPSSWSGKVTGTGATRHSAVEGRPAAGLRQLSQGYRKPQNPVQQVGGIL
jgi:hypothetical protein